MRLAGLIPEVYPTPFAQREWATLLRHRTALVAQRTARGTACTRSCTCAGYTSSGALAHPHGRQWVRTERGRTSDWSSARSCGATSA